MRAQHDALRCLHAVRQMSFYRIELIGVKLGPHFGFAKREMLAVLGLVLARGL